MVRRGLEAVGDAEAAMAKAIKGRVVDKGVGLAGVA